MNLVELIGIMGTESYKKFLFVLEKSPNRMKSDPSRPSYVLYDPHQLQIDITYEQLYVEKPETNKNLDWWVILIIVSVSLIAIAIVLRYAL